MVATPVPVVLTCSLEAAVTVWVSLVRSYLESRRARGDLAPLSRQTARYVLAGLADYLDGIDPLGPALEIADRVTAWSDRPSWSHRTRATNLGYVRPFLDWGGVRGLITPGVAAQLVTPLQPKPLPRALTTGEVSDLLAAVPDERARVIVLLEGQCGLRRAEVAGLTMRDVDLVEGSIRVVGKGSRTRVVYPSDETLEAIRILLATRGAAPGALICHQRYPGRHLTPTWIGVLVSHWMTDAGLKATPGDGVAGHALRHTTATNMLRAGANIRVVQEAMGHESIKTTAMYLRADNDEVRQAMRRLCYGSRRLRAVNDR